MAFSIHGTVHKVTRLVVLSAAVSYGTYALAGPNESIFAESYSPVVGVAPTQAQVVYFRPMGEGKTAAHLYLDGELQSALMPGGYVSFCVPSGDHSVESYIGDAPKYAGKAAPKTEAEFQGGKTYYLEVPGDETLSTPQVLAKSAAEEQLQGLRRQAHILSRASHTVPCQTATKLTLRGDLLFNFGKSGYKDLTAKGHDELRNIVEQIMTQPSNIESIEVIGHADPIGNAAANQRLSQQRADTVRKVLTELELSVPVTAIGKGSTEPVVQCDTGSRKQRVECNAPNRRVELVILGTKANQ